MAEGNTDVIRLHQIGITNTVAPCGIILTQEQAKVLKQCTNKVTLIYDGDDAGKKAIDRNAEILIREQFYVSVIMLDENQDPVKKSNFIMTPLFHIESTIYAKRLYEVKNLHNITRVIEIPQKDMVNLNAFKIRVESLGNFLWQGNEADLNRLKAWLYEKTLSAKEITQMGWNKEGFFCWGNGIFNKPGFIF